jgi:hypothetical protein
MIVIYPMVVVANIRLRHKILFFGQALHEKYDKEHVNCTRITVQSYISGCITGIRRQRLLIQDNLIFFPTEIKVKRAEFPPNFVKSEALSNSLCRGCA